jgi:hypothetical protein
MDAAKIYEAAVLVDESPQVLADIAFTGPVCAWLGGVNGAFTTAAAERGISPEKAEHWFASTEELVCVSVETSPEQAADLSVRLSALAYLFSRQDLVSGSDVDDLLATAAVSPELSEAG